MPNANQAITAYDFPPMGINRFMNLVEVLPKQEHIIEALLPKNQVMLIAGDPWQGKSLELQHLTCGLGAGSNYHGFKLKKCQSLYITWEGADDGIKDRFKKIYSILQPDIEPLIKLVPQPMQINTASGLNDFKSLLNEAGQESVKPIEVVLIDSWSASTTFAG